MHLFGPKLSTPHLHTAPSIPNAHQLCIAVLSLPPNLSSLKQQTFIISWFLRVGICEWLRQLVVAQGLSCGSSHHVDQAADLSRINRGRKICSHDCQEASLVVGQRLQLLTVARFPRKSGPRKIENPIQKPLILEVTYLDSTIYQSHKPILGQCGRRLQKSVVIKRRRPSGPSWSHHKRSTPSFSASRGVNN